MFQQKIPCKKFCFGLFQQIPWKKQARALSLILALISSLLEAAGRRVVVVVVVDGTLVVVDCNLSSSSLQIPWKKQSITFCLSLCLASLERDGRTVVVVVVVVAKVSVVGFVYTSFCEKSQPIPWVKQSLSNSVDESRLCGAAALLLDAAVVVVVVGVVVVGVVVVVVVEVVVAMVVVDVVVTTLETANVVEAAGDAVVVNLNGELLPLPPSWNSFGRRDSVRVLSSTGASVVRRDSVRVLSSTGDPDVSSSRGDPDVSSCNLLRST